MATGKEHDEVKLTEEEKQEEEMRRIHLLLYSEDNNNRVMLGEFINSVIGSTGKECDGIFHICDEKTAQLYEKAWNILKKKEEKLSRGIKEVLKSAKTDEYEELKDWNQHNPYAEDPEVYLNLFCVVGKDNEAVNTHSYLAYLREELGDTYVLLDVVSEMLDEWNLDAEKDEKRRLVLSKLNTVESLLHCSDSPRDKLIDIFCDVSKDHYTDESDDCKWLDDKIAELKEYVAKNQEEENGIPV